MREAGTAKNANGGHATHATAIPAIAERVTRTRAALMILMVFSGFRSLGADDRSPDDDEKQPRTKGDGGAKNQLYGIVAHRLEN